jgi:hypothetical protein
MLLECIINCSQWKLNMSLVQCRYTFTLIYILLHQLNVYYPLSKNHFLRCLIQYEFTLAAASYLHYRSTCFLFCSSKERERELDNRNKKMYRCQFQIYLSLFFFFFIFLAHCGWIGSNWSHNIKI